MLTRIYNCRESGSYSYTSYLHLAKAAGNLRHSGSPPSPLLVFPSSFHLHTRGKFLSASAFLRKKGLLGRFRACCAP